MIKQLITDISFDNINLTQALTRAKIIAHKIGDVNFQNWIKLENEGYPFGSPKIPLYRKLHCVVKVTLSDYFGRQREVPVALNDADPELAKIMTTLEVNQSISSIEENIGMLSQTKGLVDFNPNQISILTEWLQQSLDGDQIVRAGREVKKIEMINIVQQTKQKLLDILLELHSQFPNLDNEFAMTIENKEKVSNIITTNIYGDNNPLHIASGESVTQSGNINNINNIDYSQLEKLGVDNADIIELKEIVSKTPKESGQLKQRVLKWLGTVSASVASKGLTDNLPAITEFIGQFI
jgi:hypothetical protein